MDGPAPFGLTVGDQPSMVPFSVSNMKNDGAVCPILSCTMNALASPLKTWPVGALPRTFTIASGLFLATEAGPEPTYRVALSVPLSATHSGEPGMSLVPGDAARPHAFTRSGSIRCALCA